MRDLKGLLPLIVVGAAGLAWLLFVSEPGALWLARYFAPPPAASVILGRVTQVKGEAKRTRDGVVESLTELKELRDGDRIETARNAQLRIQISSQDEFELGPMSAVGLQLWNALDSQSPVYLTVLNGDLRLAKAGVRGRAFVVREGRLYLTQQKAEAKTFGLNVTSRELKSLHLESIDNESLSPEAPAPDLSAGTLASEPETLSNDYIDQMIVDRQGALQKCWISRLKYRPNAKAHLTLQLEINRRGKVRDLKVTERTLADPELERCVLGVIERIPFRGFKGPEISLTYPLRFE